MYASVIHGLCYTHQIELGESGLPNRLKGNNKKDDWTLLACKTENNFEKLLIAARGLTKPRALNMECSAHLSCTPACFVPAFLMLVFRLRVNFCSLHARQKLS